MRTNKSFIKRIKKTVNDKLVARKPGLNHFNAKMSRSDVMDKKRTQIVHFSKKVNQRFLGN